MSFIEVKVELRSLVEEVRRIAKALERAYPEPVVRRELRRPVDERDVSIVTNEKLWEAEQNE